MGDRRNVIVRGDPRDQGVYLYTHWHGAELARTVRDALRLRVRWSDPAYLTRILFSQMIRDTIFQETGYGISTKRCHSKGDFPHDIVVECNPTDERFSGLVKIGRQKWSFAEYTCLTDREVEAL